MKATKRISFVVVFTLVFSLFGITAFASSTKTWNLPDDKTNQVSITNVTEEGKVDFSVTSGKSNVITLYKVEANAKLTLKSPVKVNISPATYQSNNADKSYKGIAEQNNVAIAVWDGKDSYQLKSGLYLVMTEDGEFAVEMGSASTATPDTKTTAPAVTTTTPAATTTAPAVTTTAPAVTTTAPAVTTTAPAVTTTAVKAPEKATAAPTASKVLVNGKVTTFEAYNIGGNNYFKLRDLASAVNGSNKQFEIAWDASKNAIDLKANTAYTKVGGEMSKSDGKAKNAILSTSKVYKDGTELTSTAYNIGGNNFFKLRDVAKAFNIGVTWDSKTNTIGIDTNIDYSEQ